MKRAKPTAETCPVQAVVEACRLKPEFGRLEAEDQAALLLNCASVAGPVVRECAAKLAEAQAWIAAE